MKKTPQFFLLIIGCLLHCILIAQEKTFSIEFAGKKAKLSKQAITILDSAAKTIKDHPSHHFEISHCFPAKKRSTSIVWDRVNRAITYLIEKQGVDPALFHFVYDNYNDDCQRVDLIFREDIPESPPPPHPGLRKKDQ